MGAGDGRALRPRPRRRRCAADRRFRRAVPAGGVRQLPGAARDARREPVRRARDALARLRGDRGRRARHPGWARPAQALRQHGAVALSRRAGPALDAAVGGGPHQEHAARSHRSGGDGTVRAGAGDDHHLEYSSDKLRRAEAEGIRAAHRSACARVANPREPGPGTYAIQPTAPCAILTGDFNMKPEDPAKLRISAPFETGAPAFVDAWETLHPDAPHPPSFCLFDETYGGAHCCDFVFVTQDLQPRVKRVFYDTTTKVSDHQPVLVELDAR